MLNQPEAIQIRWPKYSILKVGPRLDKMEVVLAEIFHCTENWTNVVGRNVAETVSTHSDGLNN